MFLKFSLPKAIFIFISLFIMPTLPIQLQLEDLQEGEEITENKVDGSHLNECLSNQRNQDVGVCFGKEVLNNLNKYEEAESFSLATGVTFVRDEKTPRDFSSFLDKDPMDFRSMIEGASNLISKRSLNWDLSTLYPGLVMRIGPTLSNGILEFVMDPRIKDRTYHQHPHHSGEVTTGRLLARNLLVPFLLGFKFQLSTLLPLLLGLLLIASKKAFLLAKIALLAVTFFSASGGGPTYSEYGSHGLSPYSTPSFDHLNHHHHGQHSAGYHYRNPHHSDYFYKEKSSEQSTATPITPDELRDRLERLFITKKDIDETRDDIKKRNARNFAWTPINAG